MIHVNLNTLTAIPAKYANRHGLITGATGTGKSVSLMKLAEEFSKAGVPVFVSDVKSDLGALARSCPVKILDLFGRDGAAIHTTIKAMGADLLARALELSDVQSAVVEIAFSYARDLALSLDTLQDLRDVLLQMVADKDSVSVRYGQVTRASVAVVMRAMMRLEEQGGNQFFQNPGFDVAELLTIFESGNGRVSILAADKLIQSPRLYSAFLLWMLSDLYDRLPEVGDLEKPRLVFFFDEAHLLFTDCPAALLRRIEQTVRLIRSKAVGVYFVTQSPEDVPSMVREQLAHTIEHSRSLPVGVARVSTMNDTGRPLTATITQIDLPECPLGPLTDAERPAPTAAPERMAGVAGQFDVAGYLFIGFAVLAVVAITWGIWSIYAAGNAGLAIAGLIGLWLAIRKKL